MKSSTACQSAASSVGERMRAAHFGQQRVGVEAAAERQRHAVLRQHVQRQARRRARFDCAARQRRARRGVFHQFQRVRRHADHVAGFAGPVPRAAGALQQARHALRAADLQHLVHGGKSTPRSRLDVATTQRRLPSRRPASAAARSVGSSEPWCRASVAGSSGHTDCSAWYQSSACERVLVNSRLRARVLQHLRHARQLRQPEVAGPGKAFACVGQQRFERQRARRRGADTIAAPRRVRQQHVARLVEVAERGRQSPRAQRRAPARAAAPGTAAAARRACCRAARAIRRRPRSARRASCGAASGYDSSSESDSGVVTSTSACPRAPGACRARWRRRCAWPTVQSQAERRRSARAARARCRSPARAAA